mmetsp:Transcript_18939/g.19676  ORF Transcript_18939/g.19676 Transcript_18939/m.19676 type:complete len:189 (+) Transcript_18939:46-612(+)|eukprot:CAMPEP_0174819396 /NCGR_PEP_ID=MMETSP1107-20130205/2600_1 /TAXON_ID=36770 /ORGANISM="Paraphysomonas vestita, Strain GFlagA" /LENGTH=188 /DNA_ID=CAMNT_0016032809 /DNA_START=28 /DNA_END=594 /DNA_ORIENTATION=-
MVRYSQDPDNLTKAVKARVSHLRVHYKHCREICAAIKGLHLPKAKTYLQNVLVQKAAIPFTKYTGGIGRHAIAKTYKAPGDKVGFPVKATKSFLDLLRNLEANAEAKGLDADQITITHAQANQAPPMRRRTYRAHGRINPYMACPAHIELIGEEKSVEVAKEKEDTTQKLSKKRAAQLRAKLAAAVKA